MINFIGCLTAFVVVLLLSNVESIGDREAKIITIRGWLLYFLLLLNKECNN